MVFVHIRKMNDQTKKRNNHILFLFSIRFQKKKNFAQHFGLRLNIDKFKEFLPNCSSIWFESNAFVYPDEFSFNIFGQCCHRQI